MTRWTEGQLDLYKSRRQRGTKPPAPLEFALHCMIADVLTRWASPDWRWTHLPMGEYRTPATAGRLKRMGVRGNWPDFIFVGIKKTCWLELKRQGSKATEGQSELSFFLKFAGHEYLCTSSFDEALNALKEWGVVPSKINTGSSNKDMPSWPLTGENAIEERR